MLASPLPPSVVDTYSLSISFLWCNTLCIVINFSVLWPIFSDPFDEISALELGFGKLLRSSEVLFLFFPSSPLIWWCPLPVFPSTFNFPSLKLSSCIFDLAVLFHPQILFLSFIINMAHFSMPNSISITWIYIFIVCIKVFSYLSFFCKYLYVIHIYKVINLFRYSLKICCPSYISSVHGWVAALV